uniref:protein TRANSPARENT TESTA 12-like n=1 Tax=Fragaria vesca subsp. vesca TaxID=101020 RepID=UPI0005CA0E7D|nr:PREDICTED: protein TRANSPARENT TESTA 12-like [Fragaria vesca subsp. vesca]
MMKSSSSSSSLGPLPTEQTLSTKIDEVSAMESISELHHSPTTIVKSRDGDYPPPRSFHDVKNICFLETAKLWAIAGPIAFNLLCYYGINSATAIYVGRIGDVELSAVAISLSVIGNFSFGFLYGMASALETLCGQAFGAGQVGMLGIYLQRSWIIMTIASTCLLPVYIYAAPVLELLGQDENIAAVAGKFCIQIIPQMFSMAINFPTQKFLQAQSKVTFLSLFGFAMLASHVGLLGVFLKVFGRGMSSAAVAFNISSWVTTLGQLVYVVGWCRDGWNGLSWLAFKDLWSFAKLSMASAIMLCLEVWYMMTILVITGQLENAVIAVGSLSIW